MCGDWVHWKGYLGIEIRSLGVGLPLKDGGQCTVLRKNLYSVCSNWEGFLYLGGFGIVLTSVGLHINAKEHYEMYVYVVVMWK